MDIMLNEASAFSKKVGQFKVPIYALFQPYIAVVTLVKIQGSEPCLAIIIECTLVGK